MRSRPAFVYIVQALASVGVVLVLFEGAAAFLALNRVCLDEQPDDAYGWVVPAGVRVRWGSEGFGRTLYIADGEVATPHDEGIEVVVLGDSHTEAWQVDDQYKYVWVAETLLWQRGRRVNLRNLGRSGASFADYVYVVRQWRRRDPPPRAFVIQADEEDFDWHAFDPEQVNSFAWTPAGGLRLVHRTVPLTESRFPWWQRLSLVALATDRWTILRKNALPARGHQVENVGETERARTVTLEAQMLLEAANGVSVIFLRTSYRPYVSPPHSPAVVTFDALRKIPSVQVIDPAPQLVDFIQQNHRGVRTFSNALPEINHYNRDGHAIIGRRLADELERFFFSGPPGE
jgi:hypothetical protein